MQHVCNQLEDPTKLQNVAFPQPFYKELRQVVIILVDSDGFGSTGQRVEATHFTQCRSLVYTWPRTQAPHQSKCSKHGTYDWLAIL